MEDLRDGKVIIDLREKRNIFSPPYLKTIVLLLLFVLNIGIFIFSYYYFFFRDGVTPTILYSFHYVYIDPPQETYHLEMPEDLHAIYLSAWTAGNEKLRNSIISKLEGTEINAVVIDVKDASGKISFPVEDDGKLNSYGTSSSRISDMRDFIRELHDRGLYVIARIVAFQDNTLPRKYPQFALKTKEGKIWENRRKKSFLNPQSKEVWDYLATLAEYSHRLGFDEINLDYIRYPSDGDLSKIDYRIPKGEKKEDIIEDFIAYMSKRLREREDPITLSVDVFGFVTTRDAVPSIGQSFEKIYPYVDALAPMVYPSHYSPFYLGFKNPASHPYEVVYHDMKRALERALALDERKVMEFGEEQAGSEEKKYRPRLRAWIQDFDLGRNYSEREIREQIRAIRDLGINSYMAWDPSNRYTISAY